MLRMMDQDDVIDVEEQNQLVISEKAVDTWNLRKAKVFKDLNQVIVL
jgi:hypothetical protein